MTDDGRRTADDHSAAGDGSTTRPTTNDPHATTAHLEVFPLGQVDYDAAWEMQKREQA